MFNLFILSYCICLYLSAFLGTLALSPKFNNGILQTAEINLEKFSGKRRRNYNVRTLNSVCLMKIITDIAELGEISLVKQAENNSRIFRDAVGAIVGYLLQTEKSIFS